MFENLRKPSAIDKVINLQLDMLDDNSLVPDDRDKMIAQLERLAKVKKAVKSDRPSADTVLTVSAHLLGIAMIVGHERAHVITSKSIGFVKKLV